MCENGINADQLSLSIRQTIDALGTSQKWLEDLHHLADHGHRHEVSSELAQATVLLGEARARVEQALEAIEGHTSSSDVTVELV